jgi:UDP-N-acetylmuramoyl-L-alanyl-D-glutamate--2,6-diaminopimelate ligase
VRLTDLLPDTAAEQEVFGLSYSSAHVGPGDLFFCVRGFRFDGHDYAAEAVARGATALVCERELSLGVFELVVDDVRAAMGPIASRFYGDPSSKLSVVGVTGTNGKTTTTFLVRAVLESAGIQCGQLGTVASVIGRETEPVERTTPEAPDLQQALYRMVGGGDEACVMEVSSHALSLLRTDSIDFSVKVFTNLTQDHLDFHASMEDYFQSKRKLFQTPGKSVICIDDPYGLRLAKELGDSCVTCSISNNADFRAEDISFDASGTGFRCHTPESVFDVSTPLPGLFNVKNALCAIAVGYLLGVGQDAIKQALWSAPRVPGRFEPIQEGQDFAVLVDYAHTPDSLENALQAARAVCQNRLVVVFGAGGDRDRAKRPLMGAVAATLADRVIVTSDNPRDENPAAIVSDIASAASQAECEIDRRRAIELAVSQAAPGDVVLVAGKGHEQGQEFAHGRKEPFDDAQVVRELLRTRLGSGFSLRGVDR